LSDIGAAATSHTHSISAITDAARWWNNFGDNHNTRTSFDATTPSIGFGWRYIQGNTNGPGVNGAGQYYSVYVGLGNDYGSTGSGSYGMQIAYPRNVTTPYITIRYNEANSLGAWQKISAGYADSAGAVDFNNLTNKGSGTGTYTTSGDFRAPIFYDSNDTSYYVDANGTSVLSSVNTWGEIGPRRNDSGTLLRSYNTSASSALQFYLDHSGGNVNIGNNRGVVFGGGSYWEIANSVRSPIFYDSNDTGYYIDPTSTADNALRIRGGALHGPNVSWGSYLLVGGDGRQNYINSTTTASICASNGNLHIDPASGFDTYINFYDGNNINFGNGGNATVAQIASDGTFRSPVFYDYNNTGFYVDSNGTSILNTLIVTGGIGVDGGGASNDPYGRMSVTRPADANNYSYYGMTRAGQLGAGFGLDASNRFWWGAATSGYSGVASSTGMTMTVGGIVTASSDFRAPIFYDSNDTGYYVNPNSTTYLYNLILAGGGYFRPSNWIQMDGSYGMYWPNTNNAHIHGNDLSSYGSLAVRGARNGWYGIHFYEGGNTPHLMFTGANGGFYFETGGRWASYYSYAANCWGFGTSSTSSAYNIYCPTGVYSGGRVDGTIFYDSVDTAYFINANDNSNLNTLSMAGLITGRSSGSTDVNSANDQGSISIRGSTTTVAAMSFHRTGAYAINMGLGTDNVFRIGGWSASSNAFQMDGSGNLTMLNNVTAYSDARLKKDIVKIDNAIDKVQQLNGYTYTRTDTGSRQAGVIAQEVMKVLPEVVMGSEETNYSVAYGNMVGLLIEAIKEQQEHINRLEVKINSLQQGE